MKKVIKVLCVFAVTALMVSMMSMSAFAHGGHGRGLHKGDGTNRQPQHAICTVEGCTEIGPHQHDDAWYCSQSGQNSNYAVCTVDGCTERGLHQHDGVYYCCQNQSTRPFLRMGCRR